MTQHATNVVTMPTGQRCAFSNTAPGRTDFATWEAEAMRAICAVIKPGAVVLDVGAEEGEFSALYGLIAGPGERAPVRAHAERLAEHSRDVGGEPQHAARRRVRWLRRPHLRCSPPSGVHGRVARMLGRPAAARLAVQRDGAARHPGDVARPLARRACGRCARRSASTWSPATSRAPRCWSSTGRRRCSTMTARRLRPSAPGGLHRSGSRLRRGGAHAVASTCSRCSPRTATTRATSRPTTRNTGTFVPRGRR